MSEKTALIETTEDGQIRITLSDEDGDTPTLRVILPAESAYRLGEALCRKAVAMHLDDVMKDAEEAIRHDES